MSSDLLSPETSVLSVWELTRSIRSLLESEVGSVWVEGEISNHRRQSSGHQYFTLKDERSQLPCVLFRGNAAATLADGMQVQLYGELTVYELRGQYQLVVQLAQPKGVGSLQARFEALKRKLAAEGLFDAERKRELPAFPATVGLVTSPTGAALQDMLNILGRRAPWLRVVINPVRVQGQGAAAEIVRAIGEFNTWAEAAAEDGASSDLPAVDLIVVARGGGSIEDLWEFNEEAVARAIVASALPVVSAVGHEIDFTIADFAADLRAPTPSAAAELIVPDTADLLRQLLAARQYFDRHLLQYVERGRERLGGLSRGTLVREPVRKLVEARQRLDLLEEALQQQIKEGLRHLRSRLNERICSLQVVDPAHLLALKAQTLDALRQRVRRLVLCEQEGMNARLREAQHLVRVLGPKATLERGYCIITTPEGNIVRSTASLHVGSQVDIRLQDGTVQLVVPPDAAFHE